MWAVAFTRRRSLSLTASVSARAMLEGSCLPRPTVGPVKTNELVHRARHLCVKEACMGGRTLHATPPPLLFPSSAHARSTMSVHVGPDTSVKTCPRRRRRRCVLQHLPVIHPQSSHGARGVASPYTYIQRHAGPDRHWKEAGRVRPAIGRNVPLIALSPQLSLTGPSSSSCPRSLPPCTLPRGSFVVCSPSSPPARSASSS